MVNSQYIDADDYYDMGCEWLKQCVFDKAEHYFRLTIDLNPHFIYAYIDLAEVYAGKGSYHDAINCLRKAIKYDPEFDKIYYLIAKYAFKDSNYKRALESINRAFDINPKKLYEKVRGVIEKKYRTNYRQTYG